MNTMLRLVIAATMLVLLGTAPAAFAAGKSEVAGLRRLTEREYRNSIADIFGPDIAIQGSFEPGTRIGGLLAPSSAILSITPVGFGSYSQMADAIAIQVTSEKNRARLAPCAPKSAAGADDACTGQVLGHYGLMLFRRPLTADELKPRVALAHRLAQSSKDFYAGLRYGLASLLQAPDFLFRAEIAVPAGADFSLDGYSRATRLSYFLWDTTPDAELLRAAGAGELDTPDGAGKQVDRLMASPRLETGMNAFFADMLELDNLENTSKDGLIYPKWSVPIAAAAREETLRTAIDLSLRQNGDIRDLMTTRRTFINRPLAAVYGVPFTFDSDWAAYEFPAASGRSGLITQVSMLAMFSHPGRSSPTERGVAIMDIFLCEPTPTPPNNVDFSIINNTSGPLKTVRERLMAHATNPTCASCHSHSDPIGLTLEGFDTIGGRRLSENGAPIDLAATIQKKTFADGSGLGQYLHDNPKFPACVARKLWSYARGMSTEDVEPKSYQAAYQAFADSGYRLRALLKTLIASPEFFAAPAPAAPQTRTAALSR